MLIASAADARSPTLAAANSFGAGQKERQPRRAPELVGGPLPCWTPPPAAVFGQWQGTEQQLVVPDPLNGEPFIQVCGLGALLPTFACALESPAPLRVPRDSLLVLWGPCSFAGPLSMQAARLLQLCAPGTAGACGGLWAYFCAPPLVAAPTSGCTHLRAQVADTQLHEIEPFVKSLRAVPKSGVHNPLKNPERWASRRTPCFSCLFFCSAARPPRAAGCSHASGASETTGSCFRRAEKSGNMAPLRQQPLEPCSCPLLSLPAHTPNGLSA